MTTTAQDGDAVGGDPHGGKRRHNKHVLNSLVRNEKRIDESPPVILHLEGEDTADRTSWKRSLETLGERKFTTDEAHRASFCEAVEQLRLEAQDRAQDGAPLGVPTPEVFFDQLARMADHTKPGNDTIPGVAWRHTPHFMKLELYRVFVERVKDTKWDYHGVESWDVFELLGIRKTNVPTDFGDFRWLGIMDQVSKLYCATVYAAAVPVLRPIPRARSFGYRKGSKVDDCFGVLFEIVRFATKWGMPCVLGAQDVQTAFDSVEHAHAVATLRAARATPHQVLALAREMQGKTVTMHVPGIAKTDGINMSKALKTGGRIDPLVFSRMFDEILDQLEGEWDALGVGFALPDSGCRLPSVTWVDNNFLLARSFAEFEFMCKGITDAIWDKYRWKWKPSSLEILATNVEVPARKEFFECDAERGLRYALVDTMVALGGKLDPRRPDQALLRHRLQKGEASFHKYRRHLVGKAPVSLKLQAWATRPRASAMFLLPLLHWTKSLLMEVVRWERLHLRRIFRMRRAPGEGQMKYNKRTLQKLERWYNVCRFKPIHIIILERFYSEFLRSGSYGHAADMVRQERDAAWWVLMRGHSTTKRKRQAPDLVHTRRGDHSSPDDWMVEVWGLHWRAKLADHLKQYDVVAGRKTFVVEACSALQLPKPQNFYLTAVSDGVVDDRGEEDPCPAGLSALPLPEPLGRDALFISHSSDRCQVEFCVDNLTVAGLANGTMAITNAKYEQRVHNIWRNLTNLFLHHVDYKANRLDPVDWRPREWNTGADYLVKFAIATSSSGSTLDRNMIKTFAGQAAALQLYSDGGFVKGKGGAYGVQLIGHTRDDEHSERVLVGYLYHFEPEATSAFDMELRGLDTAVGMIRKSFT